MKHPLLDSRKTADFEASIRELIPSYLTQWKPAVNEPGWAVAKAFSQMAENIAHRLNGVPEKLFLAYLDRLGMEPKEAKPALAPVQFTLRKKGASSARIPQKSQLVSQSKAVFETKSEFTAQKAAISSCYIVNGELDTIGELWSKLKVGKDAPFFISESIQAHELYIRDDKLFRFEKNPLKVPYLKGAKWSYWGKDSQGIERWIPFGKNKKYKYFEKKIPTPSMPTIVNGEKGYWIKAIVDYIDKPISIKDITITLSAISGIDAMFTNDVPVDLETDVFYPFGKEPKLQDSWYIASGEAFSKSGHHIDLIFDNQCPKSEEGKKCKPLDHDDVTLSWEYYDGKSWQLLKTSYIGNHKGIAFTVPDDIALFEYTGIESYWIRARITAGGYSTTTINTATVVVTEKTNIKTTMDITQNALTTNYYPPKLAFESANVEGSQNSFDSVVTYNNHTYEKYSKVPNPVFYTLASKGETLYLGFDQAFDKGLVSLFFAVAIRQMKVSRKMAIEYADSIGNWTKLKIRDESEALQKNGTVSFLAPDNQGIHTYFGTADYWIKISFENKVSADKKAPLMHKLSKPEPPVKPCPNSGQYLEVLPGSGDSGDVLQGIYPNTVWAEQLKSVTMELAGSSEGAPSQSYALKNSPLFEPDVWVLEPLMPTDGTTCRYDEAKEAYWVNYALVDSMYTSNSDARVFELDSQSGTIIFGDGENGQIPSPGRDNILVSYRYGGGSEANGDADTIDKLISTVPAVAEVINPLPISGGADVEPNEEVIKKAPAKIRHRNRGINAADIEALAYEASRDIARVKLFLTLDSQGAYHAGGNTMVILPFLDEPMPRPSFVLREQVENYIRRRTAAVSAFDVIAPEYVRISVRAKLTTRQTAYASRIEEDARAKLGTYLHPLEGKADGSGWDFGESVCLSDVALCLERIEDVESISTLEVVMESANNRLLLTTSKNHDVTLPPYALIASGEHLIKVEGV